MHFQPIFHGLGMFGIFTHISSSMLPLMEGSFCPKFQHTLLDLYMEESVEGRRVLKGSEWEEQSGRSVQMTGSKMCISSCFVCFLQCLKKIVLMIFFVLESKRWRGKVFAGERGSCHPLFPCNSGPAIRWDLANLNLNFMSNCSSNWSLLTKWFDFCTLVYSSLV